MECPKCGADNWSVKDSRKTDDYIRRRRVCQTCGHSVSTLELIVSENASDRKRLVIEFNARLEQLGWKRVLELIRQRAGEEE